MEKVELISLIAIPETIFKTYNSPFSLNVKEIGVFGSYVKGEEEEGSDIDILVEFDEPVGLISFVLLKNYLSDLSGIEVDLVIKSALKPRIGERILKGVIYV